jgi:hypothetical protein
MKLGQISKIEHVLLEARVGREYQHLEDLVFVDGSEGAMRAVSFLNSLSQGKTTPLLKWDGLPTIYFGRLQDGEFILVGKNAWQKNKILHSPQEVYDFVMNTGRGEEWRSDFAENLVEMWRILEPATPVGFRGFYYADVLFQPSKPKVRRGDFYEFTPNKVTYSINVGTPLGSRLASAKLGIAIHAYVDAFGSDKKVPIIDKFIDGFSGSVLAFGIVPVPTFPAIPSEYIERLNRIIIDYGDDIDQFLEPVPRLSNPASAIYRFTNQTLPDGYDNLLEKFKVWISSNLSAGQSGLFREKLDKNPNGAEYLFSLVAAIGRIKDHCIDQMDMNMADISSRTGNVAGGEGYVDVINKIKMVKRTRWNPRD